MPRKAKKPDIVDAVVVEEVAPKAKAPGPRALPPEWENGYGEATSFLDNFGEEQMLEVVMAGASYGELAADLGVNYGTLLRWIGKKESRRLLFAQAREISAEAKDIEAYRAVSSIPSDATKGDIARAMGVAHHCRWQAAVRHRDYYGENKQVTVKHEVAQLTDAELEAETKRLMSLVSVPAESDEGKAP